MSRDGTTVAVGGTKRAADDGVDLLDPKSPISLKPTPRYDAMTQETTFSVAQSKEYETYRTNEEQVKQLLTGQFKNVQDPSSYIQDLGEWISKRVAGRKPEKIIVCLSGPMGAGQCDSEEVRSCAG